MEISIEEMALKVATAGYSLVHLYSFIDDISIFSVNDAICFVYKTKL